MFHEFSSQTQDRLKIVALAMSRRFPCTMVARALKMKYKETVSHRRERIVTLVERMTPDLSETARRKIAQQIKKVCDQLAAGLTPSVLEVEHDARMQAVKEFVDLNATLEPTTFRKRFDVLLRHVREIEDLREFFYPIPAQQPASTQG